MVSVCEARTKGADRSQMAQRMRTSSWLQRPNITYALFQADMNHPKATNVEAKVTTHMTTPTPYLLRECHTWVRWARQHLLKRFQRCFSLNNVNTCHLMQTAGSIHSCPSKRTGTTQHDKPPIPYSQHPDIFPSHFQTSIATVALLSSTARPDKHTITATTADKNSCSRHYYVTIHIQLSLRWQPTSQSAV